MKARWLMCSRDLGHRARLMPDRAMRARNRACADEHSTDDHPQERRQPSEVDRGHDRAHDRPGGGDRREVLAEEIGGPGGDEVDAVLLGGGGDRAGGVEPEQAGKEPAVGDVGEGEDRDGR